MSYDELKEYFNSYRLEEIKRNTLICAIIMYQRGMNLEKTVSKNCIRHSILEHRFYYHQEERWQLCLKTNKQEVVL